MVTGETVDEEAEEASPFAALEKPVVVFVADPTAAMTDFEGLDGVVLKNEKIGLAMKAFEAVRISPEDADGDLILGGHGKTVPRMLIVDPVKESVQVLEEKKIKGSALYKAMKSVAGRFYEEKLDKLVKTHLKILNERDKLHNEEKVLKEKEARLEEEDSAKAKKDLEKVREELAEVKTGIDEITEKAVDLWNLTPKHSAA